ncbi:hypothetical protein [Candidatus Blochmannia sp. SNP]
MYNRSNFGIFNEQRIQIISIVNLFGGSARTMDDKLTHEVQFFH